MNTLAAVEIANPFPGLRPFREGEEHIFFGRESQVDTMIDKLAGTRFLAVVGTSGSGKSSLVNCGLRPALHRGLMAKGGTSWRMAQFRPGDEPLKAMTRALATDGALYSGYQGAVPLEEIIDTHLRLSKRGLIDTFRKARLSEWANLLVVVDQFEELFRYRALGASAAGGGLERSQEAAAFVNLLLEAKTQADFPIYIVLTMRSDYLGDCAEFPGLPEAINEGQYLVPRLTREERRAAIAGPVGVGGADISPVLLTRLVNDVGDNPDQLSILQHALNRTWARWQHEGRSEGPLDLPHYEAIGTMAHALDQHAEWAYGELETERQRKICEKIFKALTDKGTDPRGIRRPTKLKTLCALADASPAEVSEVIGVFRKPSRSFLMPPLPEVLEPDTVIDISHETLMRVWERLKAWADEEAQSAQLYRRLSETTALHGAGKAGLWRDPELQLALQWREKEAPTEAWAGLSGGGFGPAMSFLAESEAQREREVREKEERQKRELEQAQALAAAQRHRAEEQARATRRFRLVAEGAILCALIAVLAALFANNQRAVADKQGYLATVAELDALMQQKLAEMQREVARAAEAYADEQARLANAARSQAEHQARVARSDVLALGGIESRKIPFAVQGALETYSVGKTVSPDVEGALRRVVPALASPLKRPGHTSPITAVAFSPEGTRIVTSGDDAIRIWDASSGEELLNLRDYALFGQRALRITNWCSQEPGIVFSRDGKRLACSNGRAVGVWDSNTMRGLFVNPGFSVAAKTRTGLTPDNIQRFALSSDGRLVAVGLQSGSIKVFDISICMKSPADGTSGSGFPGSMPVFSPDGKQLAAVVGQSIKILDPSTGTELLTLAQAGAPAERESKNATVVADVTFRADGGQLAAAIGPEIKVWDLSSGVNSLALPFQGKRVERVAFSPDGKLLAAGGGGLVSVWDSSFGARPRTFAYNQASDDTIGGLLFDHGDSKLALILQSKRRPGPSGNQVYILNDIDSSSEQTAQPIRAAAALAFDPHPGGNRVAIASGRSVRIEDGSSHQVLVSLLGRPEQMSAAAFSPDGKLVATASSDDGTDGTLRIWDVASGRQLRAALGLKPPITTVVFSPDGSLLATAGEKDTPKLWDVHLKTSRPLTPKHGDPAGKVVDAVAFSSNGEILATAGEAGAICFWNTHDGTEMSLPTKVEENTDIESLAFTTDGRALVSAGFRTEPPQGGQVELSNQAAKNATITLWDIRKPEKTKDFPQYPFRPLAVKYSKDGRLAVLGDKGVEVWEHESWKEVGAFSIPLRPDSKAGFTFSRDGRLLAASSVDGSVTLWEAGSGQRPPLFIPPGSAQIGDVAFSDPAGVGPLYLIDYGWNIYSQPLNVKDLMAEAMVRLQGAGINPTDCRTYLHVDPCPQWTQGMQSIADGNKQAMKGDLEGAIANFRKGQELDPALRALRFDPEQQIRRLADSSLVVKLGWSLRQAKGKVKEDAIAAYAEAQNLDPTARPESTWNNLCWYSSLRGHAAEWMGACEEAVALAPENPDFRDTRGVARALTGDTSGAIDDFQSYIDHTDNAAHKAQRQGWVAALRAGQNPFSPDVINQLLSQ